MIRGTFCMKGKKDIFFGIFANVGIICTANDVLSIMLCTELWQLDKLKLITLFNLNMTMTKAGLINIPLSQEF